MNGPKIVCAGCGVEIGILSPLCDKCMQAMYPAISESAPVSQKAWDKLTPADAAPAEGGER